MNTVRAYITTFSALSQSLVTVEETWTLATDARGTLPQVVRQGCERLKFFPLSGRVATYPALRRDLGIGCIAGEGIVLDPRDIAHIRAVYE